MKATVYSHPGLEPRNDGNYQVYAPWRTTLRTKTCELYLIVRKGFVFDGASIPRFFWRIWGGPYAAPRVTAALAHDWLYRSHVTTRAFADKAYYALLRGVGYSRFRAGTEYLALWFFGRAAWKSHALDAQLTAREQGVFGIEKKFTKKQKKGTIMKKFTFALALFATALMAGCATKTRNVELDGMYLTETGTLAIGSVEVQAAPVGEEVTHIKYEEDTAWLSPGVKLHNIKIMLAGTNSVQSSEGIVKAICDAFVETAPVLAAGTCTTCATNAPAATVK